MSFDDSFSKRVAIARSSLGLTQSELAKKVGVVPRQIAAYEGGEARPREKALINLAAALGTTAEWLTHGKGEGPNTGHIKKTVTVREVPLLSYVQAFSGEHELDDFLDGTSASDFIPAPPYASEYTFALKVEGDSMQSPGSPSFPHGSIIFVDPQITPESGDFGIFIMAGAQDVTFKQFVIDQGAGFLRSLNPLYPMIPVSVEPEAIGKVIASQQSFKDTLAEYRQPYNPQASPDRWKTQEGIEKRISVIESKIDYIIELLQEMKKLT